MLSIGYELSVPGFKVDEIGYDTLVRCNSANFQIKLTNEAQTSLYKLNVRPVIESYVGQDKPILFLQSDTKTIEQIPPKGMVPLTFSIWANCPGLVAVAIYVTDSTNKAVIAKRPEETAYKQLPVRYWFHVVDNISVEILRTLKTLKVQQPKEKKK